MPLVYENALMYKILVALLNYRYIPGICKSCRLSSEEPYFLSPKKNRILMLISFAIIVKLHMVFYYVLFFILLCIYIYLYFLHKWFPLKGDDKHFLWHFFFLKKGGYIILTFCIRMEWSEIDSNAIFYVL